MKRASLLLAASLVLASPFLPGLATSARAETAEARQSAEVFAAPGEQSRVVTRVRAGAQMTVLQRSGRWIKVRVNGRTGWIPRSVIATDESAGARGERRRPFVEGRSSSRGSRKSAPRDRVGADVVEDDEGFIDDGEGRRTRDDDDDDDDRASRRDRDDDDADDDDDDTRDRDGDRERDDDEPAVKIVVVAEAGLYAEPSRRSDEVASLREGTRVTVLERDGDWLRVESSRGGEGWVRADDVDDSAGYKYKKLGWKAGAGLSFATLSQSFSSNSAVALGNYDVSAAAIGVGLGAELVYDYSTEYLIAGDFGYRYGRATPGIRFVDPDTGDAVDTGYQTHDVDLGVALGYKLSRKTGMAAYGRLGYHYGMFKVGKVDDFVANPAKLPTESLTGVTFGLHLDIPMLTPRLAMHAGLDAMGPLSKRKQTAGLEDGDVSDTLGVWASLRAVYDWKPNLKATAQLSYVYAKTTWTGQADNSQRDHAADSTSAERTDGSYVMVLGLLRPF